MSIDLSSDPMYAKTLVSGSISLNLHKKSAEIEVFFHNFDQNLVMPACAQGKLSCFSIFNIWGNYIQAQFLRKVAKSVTIDITSWVGRSILLHTEVIFGKKL